MIYILWLIAFVVVGSLFPIAFWLESRTKDPW